MSKFKTFLLILLAWYILFTVYTIITSLFITVVLAVAFTIIFSYIASLLQKVKT